MRNGYTAEELQKIEAFIAEVSPIIGHENNKPSIHAGPRIDEKFWRHRTIHGEGTGRFHIEWPDITFYGTVTEMPKRKIRGSDKFTVRVTNRKIFFNMYRDVTLSFMRVHWNKFVDPLKVQIVRDPAQTPGNLLDSETVTTYHNKHRGYNMKIDGDLVRIGPQCGKTTNSAVRVLDMFRDARKKGFMEGRVAMFSNFENIFETDIDRMIALEGVENLYGRFGNGLLSEPDPLPWFTAYQGSYHNVWGRAARSWKSFQNGIGKSNIAAYIHQMRVWNASMQDVALSISRSHFETLATIKVLKNRGPTPNSPTGFTVVDDYLHGSTGKVYLDIEADCHHLDFGMPTGSFRAGGNLPENIIHAPMEGMIDEHLTSTSISPHGRLRSLGQDAVQSDTRTVQRVSAVQYRGHGEGHLQGDPSRGGLLSRGAYRHRRRELARRKG